MIEVHWNPVWHLGPIPGNWYGFGWAAAFIVGAALVRRWASRAGVPRDRLEDLLLWTLGETLVGARPQPNGRRNFFAKCKEVTVKESIPPRRW